MNTAKGGGVLVTGVDESSPAAASGLKEGDVILQVNRKDVSGVSQFDSAIHGVGNGTTLLLVKRGENTFYLAVQGN